ncbi:MAG: aldolase/citrate lyase family protein [Dehalococcoidia bacterium]
MRLRSILLIPANGDGLEAALTSEADAVAVTVADADWPIEELRERAASALVQVSASGKRALAVVNHPRTRLLRGDLESLAGQALGGVILPHAVEPQDIRDIAVALREFELKRDMEPGDTLVLATIDTARGVLRAAEIAAAAPRLAGLLFDGPAYAHDIGAREEEFGDRLAFARGAVIAAARAADALPVVRANAFELQRLGHYGFAGAVVDRAAGAQIANAAFTPTEHEVARARAIITSYASTRGEGGWAARMGTEVVEADSVRRARQLLAQAGVEG